MKRIIFVLCLLILTGCSSIQDMRKRDVDQEFSSNKTTKNIAECILFGWQEKSPMWGSVYIQPYDSGYTIYSEGQLEVADIINKDNRTKINFYYQGGLFGSRAAHGVEKIKNCI
ncbi:hypothetical protein [Xenorhabdus bovienii]|uniref:hypothetical protein n=1 Tax=Xenorhabdus bovienii TaxID=40576 RepID=UPI00237D24B7|nr:hypothetical protein [Xenorhabdus bovienii]MDE1493158.1 membrane lipoprotein lipid attachment site-containing protein [Xenorhabdus bovienii]